MRVDFLLEDALGQSVVTNSPEIMLRVYANSFRKAAELASKTKPELTVTLHSIADDIFDMINNKWGDGKYTVEDNGYGVLVVHNLIK